jgi:hypothetical protein
MQYAPHGVELQWRARERVASDGAATALLLEKVHGLILSESGAEATFQVSIPVFFQQRPDVTTDVVIVIAEFGGRQLPQLVLPVFPGRIELVSCNVL